MKRAIYVMVRKIKFAIWSQILMPYWRKRYPGNFAPLYRR